MTFPSAPIVASMMTVPATCADCAMAGYTGATSLILVGALIFPPTRTAVFAAFAFAAAAACAFAAMASACSLPATASAAALSPAAFASTARALACSYRLEPLAFLSFQLDVQRSAGILGGLQRLGRVLVRVLGSGLGDGRMGRIHVGSGRRCAARGDDRKTQSNRQEPGSERHGVSFQGPAWLTGRALVCAKVHRPVARQRDCAGWGRTSQAGRCRLGP